MRLLNKIRIKGTLTLETGMHIGGSEVELEIGGIDKAVVKDHRTGIPYIPGSSLKGKLRDLIARKMGYPKREEDIDETFILFGDGAKENHRCPGHIIFRDAFYTGAHFNAEEDLEEKAENTIDRMTGSANPRNIERVVKGAVFELDMIMDIYDKYSARIKENGKDKSGKDIYIFPIKDNYEVDENALMNKLRLGFRLLENDYIGGSGTRGYGKVSLKFEKPIKIRFTDDGNVNTSYIDFDFNLKEDESH